ncbi:MAG: YafY family transcriptional regulator [Acidobacteria bacterium]|nr:YafY family transcriptional regulator [Acidobacteriota bacterium]MCB9399665.1 YafY family transcriptional regulator [Acidobacteriota bacterium]
MKTPFTRVLAVLELLQSQGQLSGRELAQRVGIDGRTLRRYICLLEEMGIPITTERGRHGGYQLVTGYKLPPMMFNPDEALALSLGLLAVRGLGLAEAAPAVASAQSKLERVLPLGLKTRVRAIVDNTQLDFAERASIRDNQALMVLTAAAQARQRVFLEYRNAKGELKGREFDPFGLVFRTGFWYVAGWCHLRRDTRVFRLDRVDRVKVLMRFFERPTEFDISAFLTRTIATIQREHPVEIWLDTDLKTALTELREGLGVYEPCADGVILRTRTDSIRWFARQLTRLPFDFEIRQPDLLKKALAQHLNHLQKRHNPRRLSL